MYSIHTKCHIISLQMFIFISHFLSISVANLFCKFALQSQPKLNSKTKETKHESK